MEPISVASHYYDPPADILRLARKLVPGKYRDLTPQLRDGEILIGLYRNHDEALVATHLQSQERFDQIEAAMRNAEGASNRPVEGYYAIDVIEANKRMDPKIPT
jgi:hypothetical protein